MAFFENSKQKEDIEYLNQEREKTWQRVLNLEKSIEELRKTAPVYQLEASQSSKKAAEFRNKAEQRLVESETILSRLKEVQTDSISVKDQLVAWQNLGNELVNNIRESETSYSVKLEAINAKIEELNSILEDHPDLSAELEVLEKNIDNIEENVKKSNQSLSSINSRKKEIDDLYREIFGYTQLSEDGATQTHIEGLKDELENSFRELKIELESANGRQKSITEQYEEKYKAFESSHKDYYSKINNEIESLLPRALTAGLSYAFEQKKKDELKTLRNLTNSFYIGIASLVFISFIPICISIKFINDGIDIAEAINRLPRLVLSIFPIYLPAFWFAYSANKKMNLSKRLIEEYTHKEVLSKTFEGLSNQINNLPDSGQSEDLRIRLLTNFLQISSENPGKLISDYKSSDHPITGALEQSYKFQLALDKLEGVPGIGKLAALFESSSRRNLEKKGTKIEQALETKNTEIDDEK